jgi:hypothetical protein
MDILEVFVHNLVREAITDNPLVVLAEITQVIEVIVIDHLLGLGVE